jgi:hypothetical protein
MQKKTACGRKRNSTRMEKKQHAAGKETARIRGYGCVPLAYAGRVKRP